MDDVQDELLAAIAPRVEDLMAAHRKHRKQWYFHDLVPWEQGRNFQEEPWDESQCTLDPRVRTALVVNLLTEDNLPYYHAELERRFMGDSVYARWNRLWTAEEGQHALAIRSYLLTTRNCDPRELEDDRRATMETGWQRAATIDPAEVFTYTAAQELATRISHRNAGRLADEPIAYEIMAHVARDENHHFIFYRGVMSLLMELAPERCLEGIYKQLSDFAMPGVATPRFRRRALEIARAGVYNLRIHHDHILQPLIREWGIADLTGLDAHNQEMQEKILELPVKVLAQAEAFEARSRARGVV